MRPAGKRVGIKSVLFGVCPYAFSQGSIRTGKAHRGTGKETTNAIVDPVLLFTQVRSGGSGEVIGATNGGWRQTGCVRKREHAGNSHSGSRIILRTKRGSELAVPGEDCPGANVFPGQRGPDGGEEQANATDDSGALQAKVDRILGVVVLMLFLDRRHVSL